jgi:hypothetical protein
MVSSSSLLALQPCVGLSLLHEFVTVNFSEVVSLAPKLEDQGLYFDWPLPFELSDMDGLTRSLHSRQHSCRTKTTEFTLEHTASIFRVEELSEQHEFGH